MTEQEPTTPEETDAPSENEMRESAETTSADGPGTESAEAEAQNDEAEAQKRATGDNAGAWRGFSDELAAAMEALVGYRTTTNVFVGSTVGNVGDRTGSFSSSHLGMVLRSGQVPTQVLDRIKKSYVEPSRFPEFRTVLERQHFVIVRAPAGTGRTTTALRALDHLCREGVHKLDPDASLKSLDGKDLTENNGYLLEWLDPEQARDLRAYHADRLAVLMHEQGCRLVVIVDEATALWSNELDGHIVTDLGVVEPAVLLRQHVREGLRDAGLDTESDSVLDLPEVQELVEEVSADLSRRELAGLAELLVDVAQDEVGVADVRARYHQASDAEFTNWFEAQTETEQRAFVIALAVFNNEPVQLVSSAAKLLAEQIRTVEVPRRVDRARQVFAIPLRQRLQDARAVLVDDSQETGFGTVPVLRARFADQRYPARILERVYSEYDEAFDIVRNWLLRLGSIPGPTVRIRAGMAAGLLSKLDFNGIYHRLIRPWADSGDPDEQKAAVAALQIPSRDPAHAPVVFRMLKNWVEKPSGPESPRLQAAVRALGSTAATSPAAALRLLRRAARRADWNVAFAIGESLAELYARIDNPEQVLVELDRWAEDDRNLRRRDTALLSTLILANSFVVPVQESTQKWPIVLWVAEHLPDHRVPVVRLFAKLLLSSGYVNSGYQQFRRWLRIAQKDATQRAALAGFLLEVGGAAEELDSVAYHLDHWAEQRNGPVDAVRDIRRYWEKGDITWPTT